MAGQHGDGTGGKGEDGLPGQPYQPPPPTTDGTTPEGEGQHRADEKEKGTA
jgi:hypothetical protein